jgi:hypothetical protein
MTTDKTTADEFNRLVAEALHQFATSQHGRAKDTSDKIMAIIESRTGETRDEIMA